MKPFNVRVYGILMNEQEEILLSDEQYKGLFFTKFPGGGLCWGESLPEGLIREFMEECACPVQVERLLHVTDTFVPSAFDASQVIGVYYLVKRIPGDSTTLRMENSDEQSTQSFRWVPVSSLKESDFYFEMDQQAWLSIRNQL